VVKFTLTKLEVAGSPLVMAEVTSSASTCDAIEVIVSTGHSSQAVLMEFVS
jgi:hypothetical protein